MRNETKNNIINNTKVPPNSVTTEGLFRTQRTSLSVVIAIRQTKMLFFLGLILLLGFLIIYIEAVSLPYGATAETQIVNIENGRISLESLFSETIAEDDGESIKYSLVNELTGFTEYTNMNYEFKKLFWVLPTVSVNLKDKEHSLVLRRSYGLILFREDYTAYAYINLTGELDTLFSITVWLIILYFAFLGAFYLLSKRMSSDILAPLRKMSAILERLSVNNLHSERLDIIGTKNELIDLAIVCNDMLDRLELSYESQKQFVSNASHELRTPIAVMQGYANMLNRWGASDPEILKEAIDALCNVSKEMQELVEKLLFLSRHDRRTLKLKKDWFDVKEVVLELFRETEMVVHDRILECPTAETVMIYGDKQMLKQAMRVFVDNAIKYTEDADKIIITCRNVRDDCEIKIADTGIGMKRKDLDHIFSRFYRADDVRNRNIGGHGLGLSIAKLIIMSHCGRIHIKTQYTKGTEFTLMIPRRR